MDDLVEGAAIVAFQRRDRTVRRVAEVQDQCRFAVGGQAEERAGEVLVADTRVPAADPEVGRGDLHEGRRLAEVEARGQLLPRFVEDRQDQGDRRGRAGDVLAAAPDARESLELPAVDDDDEVPELPVFRRRRQAAGVEDQIELGGRDLPIR